MERIAVERLRVGLWVSMENVAGTGFLLRSEAQAGQNDARWLRERQRQEQLLAEVSRQAALRFRGGG